MKIDSKVNTQNTLKKKQNPCYFTPTSKDTNDIKSLEGAEANDFTKETESSDHENNQSEQPIIFNASVERRGDEVDLQFSNFEHDSAKITSVINATKYSNEELKMTEDLKDDFQSLHEKLDFSCFHKYIQELLLKANKNVCEMNYGTKLSIQVIQTSLKMNLKTSSLYLHAILEHTITQLLLLMTLMI